MRRINLIIPVVHNIGVELEIRHCFQLLLLCKHLRTLKQSWTVGVCALEQQHQTDTKNFDPF